ncbi:nose resistant to fluoxetine protein 6 [Penaeus vannamei]|uniref:nose resistant to fluoxetine protein 6 n=1 Tax=Penaeus vannamei TaxID=6689 RepID=UPI00387F4B29
MVSPFSVISSFFLLFLLLAPSRPALGQQWSGGGVLESANSLGLGGSSLDLYEAEDMLARFGGSELRTPVGQPWSLYLPVFADAASPCGLALAAMAAALESNASLGVLQMVDSWGKLPDGFLYGNPHFVGVGVYGECVRAQSPDFGLKGKFCTVVLKDNTTIAQSQREDEARPLLIQGFANTYVGLSSRYSTCIPDACTERDLMTSVSKAVDGIKEVSVMCQTLDETPQFTGADIAVISFLSIMLALMVIGTVIDVFCRFAKRSASATGARFLLPFSVYTNLEKMFLITTEPRPGIITCLTGMRVLSMGWVILGHQYLFDILISYNYSHIGKWTSGLFFQIIFNATVSTDSFLFLSGLLVSYGVLKEIKRTGKLNIIMYIVHRLIRLTPPIAVVTLFLATVARFIPSGPLAPSVNTLYKSCSDNWWMDVLYVNNFLAFNATTNTLTDCLGQCWYTAVDTQLYLVAPFVLLPLAFYPSKGKILLFLVTLVSFIIPAAVTYAYDLPPGSIWGGDDNVDNTGYERKVYYTPWCRMSAYIVGIWTGYIIFNQGSKKLVLSPVQVLTGWTVAVFSALAVLLGAWSYNHIGTTYYYDPITQVLYGGLHRGVWCLALAWVVVACHFGYGGAVNTFLSHPSWQPLSRLTYCMYLVALPIQIILIFNTKDLLYFTHVNKIIQTCGTVFLSIILAVLLSLTAEVPILGLEKIIFKRPGRGNDNPKTTTPTEKQGQDNLAFSGEMDEKGDLAKKEEVRQNGDLESSQTPYSEKEQTTEL